MEVQAESAEGTSPGQLVSAVSLRAEADVLRAQLNSKVEQIRKLESDDQSLSPDLSIGEGGDEVACLVQAGRSPSSIGDEEMVAERSCAAVGGGQPLPQLLPSCSFLSPHS